MVPNAADPIASCGRWAQGRCLRQLLRSPASEGKQSLDVLARGDQQSFYVHLLEPPQPSGTLLLTDLDVQPAPREHPIKQHP
jgi:hypothetical protein